MLFQFIKFITFCFFLCLTERADMWVSSLNASTYFWNMRAQNRWKASSCFSNCFLSFVLTFQQTFRPWWYFKNNSQQQTNTKRCYFSWTIWNDSFMHHHALLWWMVVLFPIFSSLVYDIWKWLFLVVSMSCSLSFDEKTWHELTK